MMAAQKNTPEQIAKEFLSWQIELKSIRSTDQNIQREKLVEIIEKHNQPTNWLLTGVFSLPLALVAGILSIAVNPWFLLLILIALIPFKPED